MLSCELVRHFGEYRLVIRFYKNPETGDPDGATVTMFNDSLFRLPLLWSATVTWEVAHAVMDIFGTIGYFDYVSTT